MYCLHFPEQDRYFRILVISAVIPVIFMMFVMLVMMFVRVTLFLVPSSPFFHDTA